MGRVGPQVRGGVTVLDRASAPSTAFGGPPPPLRRGGLKAQAAAMSCSPLRSTRMGSGWPLTLLAVFLEVWVFA